MAAAAVALMRRDHVKPAFLIVADRFRLCRIRLDALTRPHELFKSICRLVIRHVVAIVLPIEIEPLVFVVDRHANDSVVRRLKAEVHTNAQILTRDFFDRRHNLIMRHDFKLRQDKPAIDAELPEAGDAIKIGVVCLHLVKLLDVIHRQKQVVVGNGVMIVCVSLTHDTPRIELFITQSAALKKMLIRPVRPRHGIGRQDNVQRQSRMTQTSKQLLKARILELAALLHPDEADVVDGLELCGLVHPLEHDLAPVGKSHLHR